MSASVSITALVASNSAATAATSTLHRKTTSSSTITTTTSAAAKRTIFTSTSNSKPNFTASSSSSPHYHHPFILRVTNDPTSSRSTTESELSTTDKRTEADRIVDGLNFGELCNEFECISSPLVESTARQLVRDILELREGNRALGTFAVSVKYKNFCSRTDTVFCGVFDGHGPFGHMVAKRVRDSLPLKLSANWEVNIINDDVLKEISLNTAGSLNSDDTAFVSVDEDLRPSVDVDETEKNPEILQTLRESFLKAFKVMDRELRTTPSIDCFCSGTTAVTLIKQGRDLFIGNVGDSRAVLCTRDKDDTLSAIQLTVDLKPNLPAEAERIRKCRGRVFALQDEPEVARVWLPNNDSPGLAMARAFGDFCLKDFGLISVPDVSYRLLTEKDEFIVLATDGIWDVLSNKEVVDVIATAPARPSAAQALVETAVRAWRQKYPTSKVDDCAVVCLFLDLDSNIVSTAANNGSNEKEQPSTADEVNAEEDLSETASLVRAGTVQTAEEILADEEEEEEDEEDEEDEEEEGGRMENAAEEMNSEPGVEWSALEGVSRVNTLLNLPRFTPTKEDKKVWKKV